MEDNYRHKGMRRKLIEQLAGKGIKNKAVLAAFDAVPRHFFLDLAFINQAYSNTAFQIGAGQTISHPYTVGFQTELLKIEKGQKVLEIGTGSGFQTAILCELGARVISIERQRELYLSAKERIKNLKYNPKLFYGDGYKGQPAYAPYDRVLVTCGAPTVPETLLDQLKENGILVIPIGKDGKQIMTKYKKINGDFETTTYGDFSFVPMLERTAK